MKFSLFGYEIEVKKPGQEPEPEKPLNVRGSEAKKARSWAKIEAALQEIEDKQLDYSEYRVQQLSGVSINTVKAHREAIEEWRSKHRRTLL